MSTALDIQIVNAPNLIKIEQFLNDSSYRETIEYSASFNTRLCIERRLRLPFLDPQTGVAQNHCSLFMDRRQRMPGFREGQIYTYPSARWRKTRRQYLNKMYRPFGGLRRTEPPLPVPTPAVVPAAPITSTIVPPTSTASLAMIATPAAVGAMSGGGLIMDGDSDFNGTLLEESSSLGGADTSDSKESQSLRDDLPKEWYYDDMDINELDGIDEPKSPDDEYDYDPRYGSKKRKKRSKPPRKEGRGKGRPSGSGTPTSGSGGGVLVGNSGGSGGPSGGPSGGTGGGGGGGSTSSGSSQRRGRRKNASASSKAYDRMMRSPTLQEPPSFESAAAAVESAATSTGDEASGDRNYRKYL